MQASSLPSVIADTITAIQDQGSLPSVPCAKDGDKIRFCPATLLVHVGLKKHQSAEVVKSFEKTLENHPDKQFVIETAEKAGVSPQLVADILRRNEALTPDQRSPGMITFLKRLWCQLS